MSEWCCLDGNRLRLFESLPLVFPKCGAVMRFIGPNKVDPQVWGDSAYCSEATEVAPSEVGFESNICEKGQSNQPLSDEQQAANHTRSKTRSRVEHIFGFQQNSMGSKLIRTIGKARTEVKIGRMNLTYTSLI